MRNMRQDRLFVWKRHWKQLGWARMSGGLGSQGITRVGPTVLAKLLETQLCRPFAGSVGGGLRKGAMASASTSVWEEAALLTFVQKPDNSVPPRISLESFELLEFRASLSE